MIEGLLRITALVASAIVVLSFVLFALDETRTVAHASAAAVAGLDATRTPDPAPARERAHSRAREAIDGADDALVQPFAWVASGSPSTWVRRGVPTALALLAYGLGLSFVARYAHGRA